MTTTTMQQQSNELVDETARNIWNVPQFRSLQREAIDAALHGRDVLAVLPTGSGKSLCYQLPAAMSKGTLTVIISPLKALMRDQVIDLKRRGISAEYLTSDVHPVRQDEIRREAMHGHLQLLYVSPERCTNPGFLHTLQRCNLARFIIDEAHCISQWGHDFRPAYKRLGDLRILFPDVAISCFTATATKPVRLDIATTLTLRDPRMLIGGFDRPNLFLEIQSRPTDTDRIPSASDHTLIDTILDRRTNDNESGIIYCSTRHDTVRIAEMLQNNSLSAQAYHGDLDDDRRRKVQDWFMNQPGAIVVATIAFGMGINKPDVRFVIHSFMPSSIETWHQEIGRAGRDDKPAVCIILFGEHDFDVWVQRFEIGDISDELIESQIRAAEFMDCYCKHDGCRHRLLKDYFSDYSSASHPARCTACDNCVTDEMP